jgi:hypothetical protein
MCTFLKFYAGVEPSPDLAMIGWVDESDNKLKIVAGMHGFLGKMCQIHIAYAEGWKFSPRQMLHEVFKYAFVVRGRELLVGIVSSANLSAMRFDMHLGFTELYRIPGMHDDGADVVLLGMRKENCRYLVEAENLPLLVGNG